MKPVSATKTTKKRLIENDQGTTGVLFALLAVPMFALMGLAVDYARSLNSRESMQQSLDAAVLAGRNASTKADKIAIAQTYFKANLKKVIADATATFDENADGDLFGTARAEVVAPVRNLMNAFNGTSSKTAGNGKVLVEAYALARADRQVAVVDETSPAPTEIPCAHVMDQNGSPFVLDNNENVNASSCAVRVRSNNAAAFTETSTKAVSFKAIRVKGGASVPSGYGATKLNIVSAPHTVREQQQIVGNPYDVGMSGVARQIAVGTCTTANTSKTWTGSVNPGTYCGTTEFKNVTFRPGVYVINTASGNKVGQLKFSGNVDGSAGVTFFFADNKSKLVSYAGNDGAVLKAPTSGITRGVLFIENSNRGQNYDVTIATCKNHSWTGMVYLPSVNILMQGLENWPVFNVSVASNQLRIKGWKNMTWQAFSWTPYGYSNPITMDADREVQVSKKNGWLME